MTLAQLMYLMYKKTHDWSLSISALASCILALSLIFLIVTLDYVVLRYQILRSIMIPPYYTV